jgi:hypothetical protein
MKRSLWKDAVSVKPLKNYRLRIRFDDGVEGEIDFQDLAPFKGVFAPLRDPKVFKQVRINPDFGNIEWPNGADIDPIVLYCTVAGVPVPDFDQHQKGTAPKRRHAR